MNLGLSSETKAHDLPPASGPDWVWWTWSLLPAVLAVGVFAQTVGFGWVYDDQMEVVRNSLVHSSGALGQIFGSTVWEGSGMETYLYRPLTVLSYALNHSLTDLRAWSYHLVNVLVHALASLLLVLLLRRSQVPDAAALFGGALFLVHPANVEAVAWISQLKTSSALVLTLLALLTLERKPMLATLAW